MKPIWHVPLVALATVAAGNAATAQRLVAPSVEIGAVNVRFADQAGFSATTVSPTLSIRTSWLAANLAASFSQLGATGLSQQGGASVGAYAPLPSDGILGELSASYGGSRFPDGASTAQGLFALRAHRMAAAGGEWLGAAGGAMYDGTRWRSVRQAELGLCRDVAGARVTVMATPSVTGDTLRYTDVLLAASQAIGRLDVSATIGARAGGALPIPGGDERIWGGVNFVAWLRPHTALTLGVGTYPVDVTQGFPAGRYVQAGMRIGGLRSATLLEAAERGRLRRAARRQGVDDFSIHRLSDAEIELRVLARDASRVEVSGDLTGWRAVALAEGREGWWSARFTTTATAVELTVRVDGMRWVVPPGVMLVRDEFGGESGRVVLP